MTTPREGKPPRKQRAALSCEQCRSRKLKCNREKPCQNCIVRNKSGQCSFRVTEDGPSEAHKVRVEDMQDRINRLESLVTSLVAQNKPTSDDNRVESTPFSSNTLPPSGDRDKLRLGAGSIDVDASHSIYRGTTHWGDVLEELQEMKSVWGQFQGHSEMISEGAPTVDLGINAPGVIGGGVVNHISREELLATLPSKAAVDKLLTRFFNENDSPMPTFHLLHQPSFITQYETHWKDPSATSVMWIGQLFAILSMVMLSFTMADDEWPEYKGISTSLTQLYRLRTAQCLVMADITKCAPFTLETLLFNTMTEWALRKDGPSSVWMLVGVTARVALQMGYHRDPSHYPELSVFQGELRRRIWSFIYRLDALTSFLVGLPSMINAEDVDTEETRNLHDWELYEGMTKLPPSRSREDVTAIGYFLAKGDLIAVLTKVSKFHNTLNGQKQYSRVRELDEEFKEAFDNVPTYLKIDTLEELGQISMSLANRRIQLAFLYNHGVCVLHRKFIVEGRAEPRFALSYQRCIDSAITLLRLQHFLFTDQQAKGTKVTKHWYRVSYMTQEYILAAMILCLDLKHRNMGQGSLWSDKDQEIVGLLRTANTIWKKSLGSSPNAEKVHRVLSWMLGSLDTCGANKDNKPETRGVINTDTEVLLTPVREDVSGLGLHPDALRPQVDFDWDIWDTFIEGASFEDTYGGGLVI